MTFVDLPGLIEIFKGMWPSVWGIFKVFFPIIVFILVFEIIIIFLQRLFSGGFRKRGSRRNYNQHNSQKLEIFNDYKEPRKESIYIDDNGYERFKDSNKLVHRWVAEKKLGRQLDPEEVVHHKNRNKLDNHPSNLWVFPNQEEHDRTHEEDGDFDNNFDDDFYDDED